MSTATSQVAAYTPLRRVRPEGLSGTTAQTPGLARAEAISGGTVGAQHLWMGKAVAPAGKVSGVHHHAEGESAIYVLRGRVTLFFGEGLRERLDLEAGDFAFVPAWAIHAEGNLSGEDAEAIVVRSTPEAIAVDLPELRVPDDLLGARARERSAPATHPARNRGSPTWPRAARPQWSGAA